MEFNGKYLAVVTTDKKVFLVDPRKPTRSNPTWNINGI